METHRLTALSPEQHLLVRAILRDGREFFSSRRAFDVIVKRSVSWTLDDLYDDYKALQCALCSSVICHSKCLGYDINTAVMNAHQVRWHRQLFGIFTRLEGHSDDKTALDSYSARVSSTRSRCPDRFVTVARDLISCWLGSAPVLMDLHPKHGPGAVAEGYKNHEKPYNSILFNQLAPFGGEDLLYLNKNHRDMGTLPIRWFKHPTTRVVLVPKDLRRPRIISAEPCTMQFLQQGVARYIVQRCEAYCPYLNFSDQGINANMTINCWDRIATLDMSDASDLVSRRLVAQVFPPDWRRLLFALRSHFAELPDGSKIPLRSFAPMGSALCFPVESVVFAAISVAAILCADGGTSYTREELKLCRVYGDDIIVPLKYAEFVSAVLRECGFQPNASKCCYRTVFRESCGMETWAGVDITITRPRSLSPFHISAAKRREIHGMPMADHAKSLWQQGFTQSAVFLASLITFPVAIGNRPGYYPADVFAHCAGRIRWNPLLQRCEQQVLTPVQVSRTSHTGTTWNHLFLHLTSGWQSEQVLVPRLSAKNKWVAAAPLGER